MRKVIWLIGLFSVAASFISQAHADEGRGISLNLLCNITFSDFDGIEHLAKTEEIRLSEIKHKPGGSALVAETDHYEFWVMVHGMQTIDKQDFVNNFQVAIKHKVSLLFMHALSDTSHSADKSPRHARISLVEYYPDSTLEKGELMFECKGFN